MTLTRKRRRILIAAALLILFIGAGLVGIALPLRQLSRDQALIAAVKRGDYPAVVFQLDHGANPNAHERLVAQQSVWRILLDLFTHRSPATLPDASALFLAARGMPAYGQPAWTAPEQVPIVRTLLEHGAYPNVHDSRGTTALYFALLRERMSTFYLLVEHRAKLGGVQHGPGGDSLLFAALFHRNAETAEFLLKKGADVNFTDSLGFTPLLFVAGSGDPECVRLLLKYGADIRRRGPEGKTALDEAREWVRDRQDNPGIRDGLEVIRLLKQAESRKL